MQGGFVASPYDKTLPIQAHETWSGVPEPSCRGPWTCGRGLLQLILTVHPQDLGAGTRILGPRVSDHGPLVLAV